MIRTFLLALCCLTSVASAQLPQIRMTGVVPSGGQQGTSVDLTITAGTDLDEASELVFSHPGLTAVPKTNAAGKPVANQFTVTVAGNVPPGLYDVRVRGLFGISNPRIFRVDTLPEQSEAEPNQPADKAQTITVPSVTNGRSNSAADVDEYKIPVQAGQTIVIRSEAAAIDSVMQPVLELFDDSGRRVAHDRRRRQHDAVLIYAADRKQTLRLTVHDTVYGGGNDYGYRLVVDQRPLIDFVRPQIVQAGAETDIEIFGRHLPDAENLNVQLHGADLYRKVIRVALADPAGSVGADSTTTSVDTVLTSIDGNLLTFATTSSAVPHVVEPSAVSNKQNAADDKTAAAQQTISVPCIISGGFEQELDDDRYRFQAKKGQKLQIDVLAQRLGSQADPLLLVEQITVAEDGTETVKRIAREDNGKQNPGGTTLPTLTADPSATVTIPQDGLYQVRLKDHYAASQGAADLTYSVVIREPAPNFRLVVFESLPSADGKAVPGQSAVSLRKGGTYELPIYAYRSGGHNSDIEVQMANLPAGVTAAPVVIPAGRSSATIVLQAAADASEDFQLSVLTGVSGSGDSRMERSAKVTSLVHDSMNGLSRTARVASALAVGVMKDEEPFSIVPQLTEADAHQNQQLLIPLKLQKRTGFDNKVDLAFAGQPANTDVAAAAIDKGQNSSLLKLTFKENAATGPATLLVYGTGQVAYRRNPWLVERAEAKVAAAVAALEKLQTQLKQTEAQISSGMKTLTALQTTLKASETRLKAAATVEQQQLVELTKSLQTTQQQTEALQSVQQSLTAAAGAAADQPADLDAAVEALQKASASVRKAAAPVTGLTQRLRTMRQNVASQRQTVANLKKEVAEHKKLMTQQQTAVENLRTKVAAAQADLKAREAEKTAATAAVKKAQDATKPQNKNKRTVAVPIRLRVHPAAGTITAAVPNGGSLKKGTSLQARVTVARKNNYAGPITVTLIVPEGTTGVTSDSVQIAADKSEGMVTITAAKEAAATTIANAVLRATAADFNGRAAHFDVPVTLKIVE